MNIIDFTKEMWQLASRGEVQGIWFWAAIYLFMVCGYSLIFQVRTRFWPSVHGELVEAGVENFGGTELVKANQDYISNALYRFHVDGVEYAGTRISPWVFVASHNAKFVLDKQLSSIEQLADGKVKIYYNPANPKKSYLIVAGTFGIILTASLCLSPMVGFIFHYYF